MIANPPNPIRQTGIAPALTAMSEEDGLLQAILDDPEDDAPRLVYSDWLEDHGEPNRAAFIRLQIELARLPKGDSRHPPLARREAALFRRNADAWFGPFCHPRMH